MLYLATCEKSYQKYGNNKKSNNKNSYGKKEKDLCASYYACGETTCSTDDICLVMPANFSTAKGFKRRELCLKDSEFLGSLYDGYGTDYPSTSFLFNMTMVPCGTYCSKMMNYSQSMCIFVSSAYHHDFGCYFTNLTAPCTPKKL